MHYNKVGTHANKIIAQYKAQSAILNIYIYETVNDPQ